MSPNLQIKKTLNEIAEAFSSFLEKEIIPTLRALSVPQLAEPIIYSLSGRGKRIRPCLVFLCAGLTADVDKNKSAFYVASAVEAIHTYSLIHDDLPAMDNDEIRRGKPTCHIQFSEWAAILAGDGLNSLAFEFLVKASQEDPSLNLQGLILSLSRGCGVEGMVAGQAMDLNYEKEKTVAKQPQKAPSLLQEIHHKKTAALFSTCCELGGMLSGCTNTSEYRKYGIQLGMLFQIKDDLLDKSGNTKLMGKATKKDTNKLSYPNVFGLERSQLMCQQLQEEIEILAIKLEEGPRQEKSYTLELKNLGHFLSARNS